MSRTRIDRLDPAEPHATPTDHWGLLALLAGVRRSLERKRQDPAEPPQPHALARAAATVKGNPPER